MVLFRFNCIRASTAEPRITVNHFFNTSGALKLLTTAWVIEGRELVAFDHVNDVVEIGRSHV